MKYKKKPKIKNQEITLENFVDKNKNIKDSKEQNELLKKFINNSLSDLDREILKIITKTIILEKKKTFLQFEILNFISEVKASLDSKIYSINTFEHLGLLKKSTTQGEIKYIFNKEKSKEINSLLN